MDEYYWADDRTDHHCGSCLMRVADEATGRGEEWVLDASFPDNQSGEAIKALILRALHALDESGTETATAFYPL